MTWHNPRTNPPHPLVDVLIAVRGAEESAEGFRLDDGSWCYSTGHALAANDVYAWAPMPLCPRGLEPEPVAPAAEGRKA